MIKRFPSLLVYSTSFKAEAEAIKRGALAHMERSTDTSSSVRLRQYQCPSSTVLIDVLSILHALKTAKDRLDLNLQSPNGRLVPVRPAVWQQNICSRHAHYTTTSGISSSRWRLCGEEDLQQLGRPTVNSCRRADNKSFHLGEHWALVRAGSTLSR